MKYSISNPRLLGGSVALGILLSLPNLALAAGPWFVSPSGSDVNSCLTATSTCLTIQAAIDKASSGDIVTVASGTYPEHIMVNKPLTIEGANAGIPGNSVRADESIITGTSTGAVQLVANNISFDGFKVMSATNTLGAGMYISGTSSGSLVKNNLFTGNQKGIIANSDGVNAITMNYFTGNDFGVGVGVSSSTPTINRNGFSGNVTYGIGQTDASSTLAVNATCNWWDAVNGPGVVGVGSGDKVSANITYQPWLVSSSLSSECTGTTPAPVTATGSIIVVKNATGGDGTFGFTSDVPGHNSFNVTTASGTGSQIFTNVATGTYSITEIAQTGWTQTQNQCGINSRAVVADGATTTCIFANTKESSSTAPHGEIAGLVFEDWDADQSPFESQWEDVIPGLTVYLDTNDNGTLDSGELSIVTDSAGLYRFTALSEGTYHVRASLENGWKQIIPMSGKYDVTITSGQIVNDENFGFFKLGGIYGAKWNDSNGNGVRDASEIGIADGKITLKNEDASISLETTTDGDGDYSFLGLSKGMYALTEELRSGWTETAHPEVITIHSGTVVNGADFGNSSVEQGQDGDGSQRDDDDHSEDRSDKESHKDYSARTHDKDFAMKDRRESNSHTR